MTRDEMETLQEFNRELGNKIYPDAFDMAVKLSVTVGGQRAHVHCVEESDAKKEVGHIRDGDRR